MYRILKFVLGFFPSPGSRSSDRRQNSEGSESNFAGNCGGGGGGNLLYTVYENIDLLLSVV
jgi:hypothetical protein